MHINCDQKNEKKRTKNYRLHKTNLATEREKNIAYK